MNRRLFLLAGLALSGCATIPPPGVLSRGPLAELEPVYAVRTEPQGLAIRVASNGCTTKDDFAFSLEQRGGVATLAFGRRRLDICKTAPAGEAELAFGWRELGLAPGPPVVLLNPLVRGPGP